jgi:ABC-type sulfate transport system permease subunit
MNIAMVPAAAVGEKYASFLPNAWLHTLHQKLKICFIYYGLFLHKMYVTVLPFISKKMIKIIFQTDDDTQICLCVMMKYDAILY